MQCQNIPTLLHEWPKSHFLLKALYPMSKIDINFVFQVSKRVSCGPVSTVFATQVSTASTLYLFSLAFSKPETSSTSSKTKRWDFQLQCWCLLFQIRRNHGHLPRRRRVSPIFYLFWSRYRVLWSWEIVLKVFALVDVLPYFDLFHIPICFLKISLVSLLSFHLLSPYFSRGKNF